MKTERTKRKNNTVIFVVALLMFWLVGFIGNNRNNKLLDGKYEMTFGYINDLGFNGGGSVVTPSYNYKVDKKSFRGSYSFNQYCQQFSDYHLKKIKGKKLPVIYYPYDPKISKIVLKRKDFIKYRIEYTSEYQDLLEEFFDCKAPLLKTEKI